jgi:hypothetical protein
MLHVIHAPKQVNSRLVLFQIVRSSFQVEKLTVLPNKLMLIPAPFLNSTIIVFVQLLDHFLYYILKGQQTPVQEVGQQSHLKEIH